jgi:hypothetical protein
MPLPDYLQRALGGTPAPGGPPSPAPPTRPTGLPAYMKRALGQEDPEQRPLEEEPEFSIPFLDQMQQEQAQQPIFRPPYSEVLAGTTRPEGAPLTNEVDVEEAPGFGANVLRTWKDIGDRLSAGSAAAVGGLGRTIEEVGQGLASTPVLSPLGGPLQALGGELERFKGQEQEAARRDIRQSANADSLAGDILEAVPGMVTTIGSGFIAGPAAAIPVATGMGGAQAFGGGMQQAEAGGATRDEALAYATTSAGAEMLTEQLGDVRILRRLLEGVPGNQLTTLLKDMALGGAEEMAAETANSLARVMTYDESQTPAEALSGDVGNILRSGLVGMVLQGMGTGIASGRQEQAGGTTPATISAEQGGTLGSEEIVPPASTEADETALPPVIAELRDASLATGEPIEAEPVVEEAMPHAGSDVSPEAINRVQRKERYVRVSPGGEVLPIVNDVAAVDVQVGRKEVKAVVGQDGMVRVEQGRPNAAQQRALEALRGGDQLAPAEGEVQQDQADEVVTDDEVYDLTDYDTEEPYDAQDQEEAPPAEEAWLLTEPTGRESPAPSLPARLVTRAGEQGFIQPRALARDIGKSLKRNFTVEGLLPKRVFERKVIRDGRLAKHSERLRVLSIDLQKGIRKYKGPLSTEQLTRYLDNAYRGMNLSTGPEFMDDTQLQRIATKKGVALESVRQAMIESRSRVAEDSGLHWAPEFDNLIREMRTETEALTRQLRRQGLLTDGVARELERKYGLYVHRQYEAIRNEKWQERIQERPIWQRAVELTTDRWNRRVAAQRYDHVARKVGLRRGQKTGLEDWEISQAAFEQSPAKLQALAQKRGKGQQFDEAMQEAEQLYPAKTPEKILGLLDNYISKNSQPVLPGGRPEGAIDLSATFERDVMDELARTLLGEVRDVRSNLVTTVTKLATMVEQQAFLEDVARMGKGSFLYEEPVRIDDVSYSQQIDPGLYVKAFEQAEGRKQDGPGVDRLVVRESKKRTDPLGELYTSQDVLDELTRIYSSRSYQGFVRLYFGANVFVKAMKTLGSPLKSANRNLISNMSYALINGVVPGDLKEFSRSVAKSHGRTAGWMPGSTNRERSARVQRYLELGLFDQGTDLGDIKAMESRAHIWKGEEAMQWAKKPGEAMEFLGRWYNAPDNVAKAYVFEKLLPRYRRAFPALPVAEVEEYLAEILRDTMQNYSMVPRAIQELGQHTPVIAPFLSFWEEVIRNSKNAVKVAYSEATSDNPALRRIGKQRIAGLVAAASVPEIVSFAWKYLLNYDDEDEEAARRFMAPWNRNSQVMFLPPPKEGMVRYFDWGFIDPLAYLKNPVYRLIEGDVGGAMEALSSPFSEEILLKYLMDVSRNQKKEGGPVYNKYAPWLYRQEQKAAHLWKGLGPGSALDFQKILNAHLDDDKAAWPEYVALFGPRIVTMDIGEGLKNNAFDFMEAISASEGARKIVRDAARGRGPIEDLEEAQRVTEVQLTYSINEMIADVEAARRHDLSDETIAAYLRGARVPQWLTEGLLDGATQDIVLHYQDLDAGFAEEQEEEVN